MRVKTPHILFLALGLVLASCGKHKEVEDNLVYFGECAIQIKTKPLKAVIYVDEIKVGKGHVDISVPCGEKSIRVEKHGYAPYEKYLVATKGNSMILDIKLEHEKELEVYALSKKFIEDVMTKDELLPKDAKAVASADTGDAAESTEVFDVWNVEDWR